MIFVQPFDDNFCNNIFFLLKILNLFLFVIVSGLRARDLIEPSP